MIDAKQQAQRIQEIVRQVLPQARVVPAREGSDVETLFAVCRTDKDWQDYRNGFDSESFQIWKVDSENLKDKPYGFSYVVHDPGVRYHRDGSGTPPSDEMVECKATYATLKDVVKDLFDFIHEAEIQAVNGFVAELLDEVDTELKIIR